MEHEFASEGPSLRRETLTKPGKLGLRLLEDLTALAAGGSVCARLKLPNFFKEKGEKNKKKNFYQMALLAECYFEFSEFIEWFSVVIFPFVKADIYCFYLTGILATRQYSSADIRT